MAQKGEEQYNKCMAVNVQNRRECQAGSPSSCILGALAPLRELVFAIITAGHVASDHREEKFMPTNAFEIERDGETIIVTPQTNLRELDFLNIEDGARDILNLLKSAPIKNVIMDFHKTDYYGSTALGFFVKLWKRIRERNGKLIFCNLSEHELEVLQVTKLDALWSICTTKDEAKQSLLG
jgi:anti-anti-sigma factor